MCCRLRQIAASRWFSAFMTFGGCMNRNSLSGTIRPILRNTPSGSKTAQLVWSTWKRRGVDLTICKMCSLFPTALLSPAHSRGTCATYSAFPPRKHNLGEWGQVAKRRLSSAAKSSPSGQYKSYVRVRRVASTIKGWPIIRAAFAQIEREDFRVILVDALPNGEWWTDHSLADSSGTPEIHPKFFQAEMDEFYAQIDTLLFMSQWKETFGLSIGEASA